jgi:hypothetical protein
MARRARFRKDGLPIGRSDRDRRGTMQRHERRGG